MHYSNSSSKQTTGTSLAWIDHQLSKNAFRKCSDTIAAKLDVSEIFPQLNSQGLLTKEDCEILSNECITNTKKIQHLLYVLPRKESRFFDKFVYCLDKTIEGTGHGDILETLVANYNEEVSSADMSSGYIKVRSYVCAYMAIALHHIYIAIHVAIYILTKLTSFWWQNLVTSVTC